jgi:hypothetical protein
MAPRPELTPEQEQQALELADRIHSRSRETVLEMARRLVASSDHDLFGDTQLALRDQALGLVAEAYAERVEKKVATSDRPSIAPTAAAVPVSTATATRPSTPTAER